MIYEVDSGSHWGATEKWDRSPGSVSWCPCGEKVFLLTEVHPLASSIFPCLTYPTS